MNNYLKDLLLLASLHILNFFRLLLYRLLASLLCILGLLVNFWRFIEFLKLAEVPSSHKKRVILCRFIRIFEVRLRLNLVLRLLGRISLAVRDVDH